MSIKFMIWFPSIFVWLIGTGLTLQESKNLGTRIYGKFNFKWKFSVIYVF